MCIRDSLKNRITPVIIEDSKKAEYYEWLNRAQQKNECERLFQYFAEEQAVYEQEMNRFIIPVNLVETE